MYAFTDENGNVNQSIETGLSRLEDQFKRLRQDKIMGCAHLTDEIRPLVQQPLLLLPLVTNREACWLSDMTITILCASDECGFITSDAPVVWFDPELHKMPPFYRSLALGSPTIEVTMPIAPSRLVLFTHGRVSEGYFPVVTSLECGVDVIDDLNRRARFHCDSHFVASSDRKKDIWFDPGLPPPGWHS
jgi:hypothetical protein